MGLIVVALVGLAAIVTLAFAYTAAAVGGFVPITWEILAGWLGALFLANLGLALAVRRRWEKLSMRNQLLAALWLPIAGWYWTVAPLFSFLALNLDNRQLVWTAFAFLWEVPLIGGAVFIPLSLWLLSPARRYMEQGELRPTPEQLYRATLLYPLVVSALLFGLSVMGYAAGTAQLRMLAGLPLLEQGKNLVAGVLLTLFLAVFLYLVLDEYFGRVRDRLKREHQIVRKAWRNINTKIITVSAILVAGSIGLLGLTTFHATEALLGQGNGGLWLALSQDSIVWGKLVGGVLVTLLLTVGLIVFTGQALTRALRLLTRRLGEAPEIEAEDMVLHTGDEVEVLSQALADKIGALAVERNLSNEAKARSEAVLDSLGEGLVVTDPEGRILRLNRRAEQLIGWRENEVLGQRWPNIVQIADEHNGHVPRERTPLHQALRSGKSVHTDAYTYQRRDGARFPVSITAAAFQLEKEVVGAVLVFRDITREKAVDQAKTEFVSLASHQLRTPLTAITWYLELLLREGQLSAQQRRDIQKVRERGRGMVQLVNDLLNVSRLDTGRLTITPEKIDLAALLSSVVDDVMPLAAQRGCRIIFHRVEESFPPVSVDRGLLRQVFHNVLVNAIRYSHPHREPQIWAQLERTPGRNYLVSIQDNGLGIPRAMQGRVFDKFFRADNAVRQETEGTGLGLYVAKMILKASGGKIWFESTEGQGTTFFIEIPAEGMRERKEVAV